MSLYKKKSEFDEAVKQYWKAYEKVGNLFLETDCPIDRIEDLAGIFGIKMLSRVDHSGDMKNMTVLNFAMDKDVKFQLLGELLKEKYRVMTNMIDNDECIEYEIIIRDKKNDAKQ